MDTEYFEVEAKAEGDGISAEEMRRMTQALLEDRFQLKSHRVERESAVYHLVVAKGGLKIKPSEDQTPPDTPQSQTGQRGFAVDASGKQARGTFMLIPSPTGIVQSYSAAPISTAVGLLTLSITRTSTTALTGFRFNPHCSSIIDNGDVAPPGCALLLWDISSLTSNRP